MRDTANCFAALDRHVDALNFRREVLKVLRRVLPSNHVDIGKALMNTAISYETAGKHHKAIKLKEEALTICRKTLPGDHPVIASSMLNISNSYSNIGCHKHALDLREQAVAIYNRVLPDHPDIFNAVISKAVSLCLLHRYADAFDLVYEVIT
jgi:tetratricopeptide (TPR) repeat protein